MFGFAQPARIFLLVAVCCTAAYADVHPNQLASAAAVDTGKVPDAGLIPENKAGEVEVPALASLRPDVTTRDDEASKPSEPFRLPNSSSPSGEMPAKWRDLQSRLSADAKAVAACRSDESACSQATRRFLAIVEFGHQREGRARLGWINRAVNLSVTPATDWEQYGYADFWASPLQTLSSGSGDCEDYAIIKYAVLRELGFDATDLRFVIVRDKSRETDHAVIAVRDEQGWLILDNRTMAILKAEDAQHYQPLFSFDEQGAHAITTAATDQIRGQ